MNGKYFPTPTFPAAGDYEETTPVKPAPQMITQDFRYPAPTNDREFFEENKNYIEHILKQNKGKHVIIQAFLGEAKEDIKIDGIIESSGTDHLIISNPNNGEWYLIPITCLNFITFEEKINF